ncbi:MAG: ferrochelatase [Actinomycetota bacterium]
MPEHSGVLVMAYGTPAGLKEIEGYYTDIRGGRPPSADELAALISRYEAIGGRSPLLEISRHQAEGLQARLEGVRTYLGMKHSEPTIPSAIAQMAADGVTSAVGLVLAPHYSSMSVGDYARRAHRSAEEIGYNGKLEIIESWHLEPGFIDLLAGTVRAAWNRLSYGARSAGIVVFTAHSLSQRILQANDPYPEQLRATAQAVADSAGITRWRTAWQSAPTGADDWLGPDLAATLTEIASFGGRGVVVCPCGFVSDHLEVLYDIDVEAREVAAGLGLELVRTELPNDDPAFLDTLCLVVRRALRQT